jgi:hypothetical protein
LKIPKDLDTVRTKDNPAVALEPAKASLWRSTESLNSAEVTICEVVTRTEMMANGYEAARVRPNPFMLMGYAILLPFKILIAVAVNLGRIGKLGNALARRR